MRADKLSKEIKKHLSSILSEMFLGSFISVVKVTFTEGIKTAHVFLSIYGEEKMKQYREIDKKKAKIREALAQKMRIRRVPNLVLRIDDTIEYSQKISNIISGLKEK